MKTMRVLPAQIFGDVCAGRDHSIVDNLVEGFVIDAAPQALREHDVPPGATRIHGQLATAGQDRVDEFDRDELAALVGVDDLRRTVVGQGMFDHFPGEYGFQCDRHHVRQNAARGHFHHGGQINEAVGHRDVGLVQRPDLVGAGDSQLTQQIRIDHVYGRTFAGTGLRRQRLDAQAQHERSFVLPPYMDTLPGQLVAQSARPHEGGVLMQFVDSAHQRQIGQANLPGQEIHRFPADIEQARLMRDAEFMVSVDHGFAPSNPALVSALSKKLFSSASYSILACSGARFTGSGGVPPAITSAICSSNGFFHSPIWFGCGSSCVYILAKLQSSRRAAKATCALNTG